MRGTHLQHLERQRWAPGQAEKLLRGGKWCLVVGKELVLPPLTPPVTTDPPMSPLSPPLTTGPPIADASVRLL